MTAKNESRWDNAALLESCIDGWIKGHSAQEIGDKLGLTRCMVIGKMHRCNIRHGVQPKPQRDRPWTPRIVPPEPRPEPLPARTDGLPRWKCPCGATAQPGRDHCGRCISKAAPRNKRAGLWAGLGSQYA